MISSEGNTLVGTGVFTPAPGRVCVGVFLSGMQCLDLGLCLRICNSCCSTVQEVRPGCGGDGLKSLDMKYRDEKKT